MATPIFLVGGRDSAAGESLRGTLAPCPGVGGCALVLSLSSELSSPSRESQVGGPGPELRLQDPNLFSPKDWSLNSGPRPTPFFLAF